MGEWIYRDADMHKCRDTFPGYSRTVKVGDRWKCDCGKKWRVKSIEGGMQWDPIDPPSIRWEEVVEHGVYWR